MRFVVGNPEPLNHFITMSNIQDKQTTPSRYINVLIDDWFKRIFGDESRPRLLQLFLQEIIPERKIISLTYAPQEHTNQLDKKKSVRVDVECTDDQNRRFIVEMQLAPQHFFYERAIFNSTFGIQHQIKEGETSYFFPTVYFIGITGFPIHEGSDRVRYHYKLREEQSGELMSDQIQYIFLELPNSESRAMKEDSTILENFCYSLYKLPELTHQPEEFRDEIFRLLFESTELSTFAPEDRIKYLNDMTTERDIHNQIEYARDNGAQLEKERIVKQLVKEGVNPEILAKVSGLSKEQILAL